MAIANKLRRKIFGINWNGKGGNNDSKIDKKLKRKLEKHKKK